MDPSISSARIPDPASGVAFLQVWDTDSAAARSGWFQDMSVNIHLLRAKPGFVSMTLHRSLDQKSLCVYAQWTSQTHLGSAVIDPYVQGARAKLDRWARPDGRPYTFHSLATPTASRGGARTIWAIECLGGVISGFDAIGFSPTAAKFASRIGSTSRNAVASVKKVLLAGAGRSLDEVKQLERAAFAALFGPEQRARMKSFLARTSG